MMSTATQATTLLVAEAGLGRWLSDNPGKRVTERYWLYYTVVWAGAAGAVMLSGLADRWGDVELIGFATILAVGAMCGPVVFRPAEDRGIPIHRSAAFKLGASVVGFSILLNYTQTPFFFDVLHMHYGFQTHVNVRNNPVGLYIMTIPYFATYCALCQVAYRWVVDVSKGALSLVRWVGVGTAPFVIAFLETLLNANPFLKHLFCYDDLALMLWFGTFAYGTAFCFAMPVWLYVDEAADSRIGLGSVCVLVLAAVYADSLMLDLYRYHLAPHVTTVVDGAPGLRDYAGSCLEPLP